MKKLTSYDYLPNTNIYLTQRKDMFRINTDTALLGQFMQVHPGQTVLDLGCNNGALMLYASLHQPSFLYGVEIQEEACELARQNLLENNIENALVFHADICSFIIEKVDVICSNPPYFNTPDIASMNETEALRIARHEVSCPLDQLARCAARCLKEEGRFYLVHRASRIPEILQAMDRVGLHLVKAKLVYDENKEWASGVLMEFSFRKSQDCYFEKPCIISR